MQQIPEELLSILNNTKHSIHVALVKGTLTEVNVNFPEGSFIKFIDEILEKSSEIKRILKKYSLIEQKQINKIKSQPLTNKPKPVQLELNEVNFEIPIVLSND